MGRAKVVTISERALKIESWPVERRDTTWVIGKREKMRWKGRWRMSKMEELGLQD